MFKKVALRLALQNTLILYAVVVIFSVSIFAYMNTAFGNNFVDNYQVGHADTAQSQNDVREVADAGLNKLEQGIIIVDVGLLLLLPIVGYYLARRSLKPVKESYELQEAFTDNASHELRTPLSVLSGTLELVLRNNRTAKEYKAAISESLIETRSLIELTNQLLLLSRGDEQSLRKNFKKLNAHNLFLQAINGLNLSSQNAKRIIDNVSKNISIYGDEGLLTRAISNLISNSVKYSSSQDKIFLSCQRTGKVIRIEVRNEGKGMSKLESTRSVNRFWRADSARNNVGNGLGLSITERIARLHNGKLEINSSPSTGTIVTLVLLQPNHST
jgi:signal transduction histidine kinase